MLLTGSLVIFLIHHPSSGCHMYDRDQEFSKFALLALASALIATPFVGIFALVGVGVGLWCLWGFVKKLR